MILIFFLLFFLCTSAKASNLDMQSKTSSIQVAGGATFSIDNPISAGVGKIITDTGATISGTSISFADGVLEDQGNQLALSGMLDVSESGYIVLNGNKKFSGSRGTVYQSIYVSGVNNRLEGDFLSSNDIELADASAHVTLDIRSRLNSNLQLNGGLMTLDEDLRFIDTKRIVGPGTIRLNDRKLSFGAKKLTWDEPLYFDNAADIELNANVYLNSTWTFSGQNVLCGSDNLLFIEAGGKLVVAPGASLLMKNVILRKVSTAEIFCMDNSGTVSLQNVTWYLDSDYTLSQGHFDIINDFTISGTNKFIYSSPRQSMVYDKATLIFDGGITFSYDAPGIDRLAFEACCATLLIRGSTLHVTATGVQLTNGCIVVDKKSCIVSETYNNHTTGIIFGNNDQMQNFNCKMLNASRLNLLQGILQYRNVSDDICEELDRRVILEIGPGATLKLDQTLNLGTGALFISANASLIQEDGATIVGDVNYF